MLTPARPGTRRPGLGGGLQCPLPGDGVRGRGCGGVGDGGGAAAPLPGRPHRRGDGGGAADREHCRHLLLRRDGAAVELGAGRLHV